MCLATSLRALSLAPPWLAIASWKLLPYFDTILERRAWEPYCSIHGGADGPSSSLQGIATRHCALYLLDTIRGQRVPDEQQVLFEPGHQLLRHVCNGISRHVGGLFQLFLPLLVGVLLLRQEPFQDVSLRIRLQADGAVRRPHRLEGIGNLNQKILPNPASFSEPEKRTWIRKLVKCCAQMDRFQEPGLKNS